MSEAQAEAAAEPEPVSDSGSDTLPVSDSESDAPAEPLAADADVAPGAAGEPAAEAEASEPEHPRVLLSGALSTVAQFAVQAGKQGRISAAKHHWAQGNETDSPAPGHASDPRFAMYCLNMWKVRQHFVDKQERTRKIWGLVSYLTFYAIWVYFVMKVPPPAVMLKHQAAVSNLFLDEPFCPGPPWGKVPYYTAPHTTPHTTLHLNKNREALRQRKLRQLSGPPRGG